MPLYTPSGAPGTHASGSSAAIRAEFGLIKAALDKFPDFTGNGGKLLIVKSTEDMFSVATSIDGTPIGAGAAASGAFTTLAASAAAAFGSTLTVAGNVTAPAFVGNLTGNAATATNATHATSADSATSATTAANATNAANAAAVPWTGVSGRPTNVSQFANDAGYVTSIGAAAAGSLTGTTMAANVVNSSLTSLGTLGALAVSGAAAFGSVTIGGQAAIHAGNISSYAPSPTGGGASGTWGINISGNSASASSASSAAVASSCSGNSATATTAASCSGNAATATTAASCSGNAATATNATHATSADSATTANTANSATTAGSASTASNVAGSGAATVASLTATGLIKGNNAGQGLGAIRLTTTPGAPGGTAPGDITGVY